LTRAAYALLVHFNERERRWAEPCKEASLGAKNGQKDPRRSDECRYTMVFLARRLRDSMRI